MDVENKDGALQAADKEIQQRDEELFDSLRRSKKERRKKRIRTIAIVMGVLAVVLIAAVLILRRQVRENFAMDQGEVLSATVERGTISTVVSGSGMLENVDTETVTLPPGGVYLIALSKMLPRASAVHLGSCWTQIELSQSAEREISLASALAHTALIARAMVSARRPSCG